MSKRAALDVTVAVLLALALCLVTLDTRADEARIVCVPPPNTLLISRDDVGRVNYELATLRQALAEAVAKIQEQEQKLREFERGRV